ncbi:hypothetical protein L1987_32002 [Smallanthus sonchifolius]|uniref:Uncharacterized protein n=1 Tax=Smallanthus sonchifolius TaxID=185202 RepID=A0ACB9I903_9ASTR|nr:hypothetical protein L1987_32002 [Smallanthus sonchifolius]
MNGTSLQKTPPRKHWKVLCGHQISTDGLLLMPIDSPCFPRKTPARARRVGFLGLDQLIIVVMEDINGALNYPSSSISGIDPNGQIRYIWIREWWM